MIRSDDSSTQVTHSQLRFLCLVCTLHRVVVVASGEWRKDPKFRPPFSFLCSSSVFCSRCSNLILEGDTDRLRLSTAMRILSFLSWGAFLLLGAHAFVITTPSRHQSIRRFSTNNDESSANPAAELTNTLARLDRQWKIQQYSKPGRSRWTTLRLDGSHETVDAAMPPPMGDTSYKDIVYLLEPPNKSVPSCLIVFVGGAGLGTYPQIAYNELLLRISNRLNAAVLSAPYNVGLDHFQMAKDTGERTQKAIEYITEDPAFLYPVNLPVYCISHSLGGKLATIHMAATNQEYAGMGMISFNNFGFGNTIGMAKEFAEQIQANMVGGGKNQSGPNIGGFNKDIIDQVFSFAEMAVSATGIEFSPNPGQMEKLIALKYDGKRQAKTRLITFDGDTLQNTQEFVNACPGPGPEVSELTGTHLTPVYFEFGLDQIPDEATQDMVREVSGGFEKASFGDEEQLQSLVNEICSWLKGNGPSRRPDWKKETPLIASSSEGEAS
jgi:hypothetical protein